MEPVNRDMIVFKPISTRVNDHNHNLDQTHGFSFIPFPKIPRPRQAPPVPERSRQEITTGLTALPAPYGQRTMDIQHQAHAQLSQPSTVTSMNSRSLRAANAATLLDIETPNLYHQVDETHNSLCSKCHGVILAKMEAGSPEASLHLGIGKGETSWNYIYPVHHPALQRNNSIGGFTLTGQDSQKSNRSWLSKACSSHKIALVVSTFSFLVTIGLTITLILMKNKGMMEPM